MSPSFKDKGGLRGVGLVFALILKSWSSFIMFQFKHYQPRPLEIIDTTLREGSQTSLLHDHYKYFFTQDDKIEIARDLITFGVKF